MASKEKATGLKYTEKVQKTSKKSNTDYYKEVLKKIKDFNEPDYSEDFNPVKRELDDVEQDLVKTYEYSKGNQHLKYDLPPDEYFRERAENAIKGDSTMGNGSGEGYANTEPSWHGSRTAEELGDEIIKHAKDMIENEVDPLEDAAIFGNDLEFKPKKSSKGPKPERSAFKESKSKKKTKKESVKNKKTMMKLTYKTTKFKDDKHAMSLIPERYKVDGKVFEMTDGDQSYRIRWEGTVRKGTGAILMESNQSSIKNEKNLVEHLYNYNSADSHQKIDVIEENQMLRELMGKTRELLSGGSDETED